MINPLSITESNPQSKGDLQALKTIKSACLPDNTHWSLFAALAQRIIFQNFHQQVTVHFLIRSP